MDGIGFLQSTIGAPHALRGKANTPRTAQPLRYDAKWLKTVLQLRLVSKKILMALKSSSSMDIKIRNSVPRTRDSRWFNTVKDALLSARLRPLSLLSLSIRGNDLHSLVETLVVVGTAIQQLEITYLGNGKELLAAVAPIASLGNALTMKISVEGSDRDGRQMSLWLQHLVASSIRINSISFRSVG